MSTIDSLLFGLFHRITTNFQCTVICSNDRDSITESDTPRALKPFAHSSCSTFACEAFTFSATWVYRTFLGYLSFKADSLQCAHVIYSLLRFLCWSVNLSKRFKNRTKKHVMLLLVGISESIDAIALIYTEKPGCHPSL